jgi:hypothetical protein
MRDDKGVGVGAGTQKMGAKDERAGTAFAAEP